MEQQKANIYLGYSWDQATIENRITPVITFLHDHGYECSVITPGIEKKNLKPYFANFKFVNGGINRKENIFSRLFKEVISAKKVTSYSKSKDIDLHLYTVPSFMLLIFGNLRPGYKILDIRDALWVYLKAGPLHFRLFSLFLIPYLKRRLLRFDLISCTNQFEKREIVKLIKNKVPVVILPNGISQKKFNLLKFKESENITDKFEITYAGNIGYAQNLETFINAISFFPEVTGNIIGEGADLERIKKYAFDKNIVNVKFYGRLPWEKLIKIYQKSSFLYCQLSSNFYSAIPSKLYEYLSTNKPVIYGGHGAAVKFLDKFEGVYVCKPDDHISLRNIIKNIISQSHLNHSNKQLINRNIIENEFIRESMTNSIYNDVLIKLKNSI